MWTDRCHRICTRCAHINETMGEPHTALTHEVRLVGKRTGEGRQHIAAAASGWRR
ncbi:hypothetical protein ACFL09_04380 [Planctomycetota bacterium]